MRTEDFDFELPRELVAQNPAEPRDASRLMVVGRQNGEIQHRTFRDLPGLLSPGDLIVVNDTRVMAGRLHGVREDSGGRVEALLTKQIGPRTWETLFRPARRATAGRRFVFDTAGGKLTAVAVERNEELVLLEFEQPFDRATVGSVPLPPYITEFSGDPERYQTTFAQEPASAAAPTAGLHFTPELFSALEERGIAKATITLDIGPATFRPVTVSDPAAHHMHSEKFNITAPAAELIQDSIENGSRIVGVGTTVVRTLEHAYREAGRIEAHSGETDLFLLPGDRFHAVNALVTNFHLPRSTLLMLVSAFGGQEAVLEAYRQAVAEGYRFYSFGDAMLIL